MSDQTSPPAQDENHLIAERRQKLAEWRASGKAYPNDFSRENTAGKLDEVYGEKSAEDLEALPVEVKVAGRIMLKRVSLLCPITSAVGAATPCDGTLRGAGGLVDAGKPLGGGRTHFAR